MATVIQVEKGKVKIDDRTIAHHVLRAGFGPGEAPTAVAVCLAESFEGKVDCFNVLDDGRRHYSLFQISSIHNPDLSKIFWPDYNCGWAFRLSKGGTDFTPWSSFKTGAHLKYMERAKTAVALEHGSGSMAAVMNYIKALHLDTRSEIIAAINAPPRATKV